MTMQVVDCVQGDATWVAARLGRPTASRFGDVMALGEGKVRDAYLYKLAGEIVSGVPMESFTNSAMAHGNAVEPEARQTYELLTGVDVKQVGFIINGRVGCSPDGLVGDDGMVEIKRQNPDLLLKRIIVGSGDIHTAQIQGNLWVADRKWIDLAVYFPNMKLYRRRFHRDNNFIARLKIAVDVFLEDLDHLVAKYHSSVSA